MKRAGLVTIALLAAACGDDTSSGPSMKRGKRSEAEINLDAIKKSSKALYAERAEFFKGSAPLTPAESCCQPGGQTRCPANAAQWQGVDAWDNLDFEVTESHYFRYSYEGDGQSFVARAVSDLDCDGVESTYELHGKVENGMPVFQLIKPARAD